MFEKSLIYFAITLRVVLLLDLLVLFYKMIIILRL